MEIIRVRDEWEFDKYRQNIRDGKLRLIGVVDSGLIFDEVLEPSG